jgi:hypothetical protein
MRKWKPPTAARRVNSRRGHVCERSRGRRWKAVMHQKEVRIAADVQVGGRGRRRGLGVDVTLFDPVRPRALDMEMT